MKLVDQAVPLAAFDIMVSARSTFTKRISA
jgi:hypothetical protein